MGSSSEDAASAQERDVVETHERLPVTYHILSSVDATVGAHIDNVLVAQSLGTERVGAADVSLSLRLASTCSAFGSLACKFSFL